MPRRSSASPEEGGTTDADPKSSVARFLTGVLRPATYADPAPHAVIMPIRIERVPFTADELQELGGEISDPPRLGLRIAGVSCLGAGVVALGVLALTTPATAFIAGGAAIVLVVIVALLTVSLIGDLALAKLISAHSRQLRAILDADEVEVVRMKVDQAWLATPADEDQEAILLRSGDDFVYLNASVEELLYEGDDAEESEQSEVSEQTGAKASRLPRITSIRRLPDPDGRVLAIATGAGLIVLDELPDPEDEDEDFARIAARAWGACVVLRRDELPQAWRTPPTG